MIDKDKALKFIEDMMSQSALESFKFDSGLQPSMDYLIGQYHACLLCREIITIHNIGEHMSILRDKFSNLYLTGLNIKSAYFDGFINILNMLENFETNLKQNNANDI